MGRKRAEHARLRIFIFLLWRPEFGHLFRSAAELMEIDVVDLDVLNVMVRHATDYRTEFGKRSVAGHIADQHAFQPAHSSPLRTAHASAQPQKQRRIADVAHGDADECNVLGNSAIDGFKREAATALEDTV